MEKLQIHNDDSDVQFYPNTVGDLIIVLYEDKKHCAIVLGEQQIQQLKDFLNKNF